MVKETEQRIEPLYGTFVFIGTPIFSTENYYSSGKSEGGFTYHKVRFGIKTKDNNIVYVELSGGYNSQKENIIYATDLEGNKLEINWMDRFNPTIIKSVTDMRKFKINFETNSESESKTFLSPYDAVQEIKDNLTANNRIVVIGNCKVERYKDRNGTMRNSIKYNPQKIRLAKDEEINKSELTLSFVFDKECVDFNRLKTENIADITAYTTFYDKTLTPNRNIFIPLPLVLNFNYLFETSTIQLNDEQKKMLMALYKKYFTAKSNEYFETQWKCEVVSGHEELNITMDDLSVDQKLLIQLGQVDFETVVKKMRNKLLGDKIDEIRLLRPTLKFVNEETELPEVNKLTKYNEDDFYIPSFTHETLVTEDDEDTNFLNRMFPA